MGKFLFFGATKGLGLLTAKLFQRQGHEVVLIGRNVPKKLENLQFFHLDLMDGELLIPSFQNLMSEVGKISGGCFFQRLRPDNGKLEQELQVSVIATQILMDESIKYLDTNDDHPFTFVSSVNSEYISKNCSLGYHVAKASLDVMAKYFAVKYGYLNVRCNTVNPSGFMKPETEHLKEEKFSKLQVHNPIGRILTAENVAEAILFASSQQGQALNGANIILDNGVSTLWPEGS